MKLNLIKFVVFISNVMRGLLFFFSLRVFFLKLLGNRIGQKVAIHSNVRMLGLGNLNIGDNVCINWGCLIDNRHSITIGNNVNISHSTRIYTVGHDIDDPMANLVKRDVKIENNVWIFPNALIMPGVTIGEGAVVYPGAVVIKSVEPFSIVGGNPARHIRYRNKNLEYNVDFRVWFAI